MHTHVRQVFAQNPVTFSFEFFPPKDEPGEAQLMARAGELASLNPGWVSVTCGAGGSGGAGNIKTRELTLALRDRFGLNPMAHLTCVGRSREQLRAEVEAYQQAGVDNIMALRGDPPKGDNSFVAHPQGLRYAADLVKLIREVGDFGIGVAGYPEGHPETTNKLADLDYLRRKVDAGADFVVTQLFFDNHDFYDFVERCRLVGITVPILAGIMPVLSSRGVERMCGMCGARIPAGLMRGLITAGDNDAEVAKVGTEWAARQVLDLLDQGVRGIHFYTLNRSKATLEIYRHLGRVVRAGEP